MIIAHLLCFCRLLGNTLYFVSLDSCQYGYLDDVLHVSPAEVHGPAVDVVQHQLHVVALDHGQQQRHHVVPLFLVVDQQLLQERGHGAQDDPVGPQAGVLQRQVLGSRSHYNNGATYHTNYFNITEFSADKCLWKHCHH